jgi:hypothetical protein
MPLITNKSAVVSAELASQVEAVGRYLNSSADHCNAMSRALLALGNTDLENWLNSQPIADLQQLFADHLNTGTQINEAISVVNAQLESSDMLYFPVFVDVRDFATKLAEQQREATFDGATWSVNAVVEPPVEPQPE